ncbi:MAG TPA: HAD-IB family phosphatase [Candidatus Limnocylindrales bacterium]|nr:HAD-IB family phosphatase [Candidatus Limnocylindrales bacterium]
MSEPADAPLVVLIDYDGTIARSDVSDEVMWRYADRTAWAPLESAYLRGDIGSRTLLSRQAALLHGETERIAAIGDDQALDPHFVPFVEFLRGRGIPIEVVSDGFGFFVGPSLARIGLADVPVFTARTSFPPGEVSIDFPAAHPVCRVCGTCKRERILVHQRAGAHVVFVGDGFSDLYAANHADTVFAKDHLAELCRHQGWPFHSWDTFADIQAAIGALLARRIPPPRARPFICGPEAWPVGTEEPIWERPPGPGSGIMESGQPA